jgi:hypothetical protein
MTSALALGFAGDEACLLKNDLMPSVLSDTGCMNVGESFPILPTSGGTGKLPLAQSGSQLK